MPREIYLLGGLVLVVFIAFKLMERRNRDLTFDRERDRFGDGDPGGFF